MKQEISAAYDAIAVRQPVHQASKAAFFSSKTPTGLHPFKLSGSA